MKKLICILLLTISFVNPTAAKRKPYDEEYQARLAYLFLTAMDVTVDFRGSQVHS